MKKYLLVVIVFISSDLLAQTIQKDFPEVFSVKISNPLKSLRENVLVVLSPDEIKKSGKKFNDKAFVVVDGTTEIPSQYNRGDKSEQGIVFVLPKLEAMESRNISVRFHPTASIQHNYPKRTQAELSPKTGGAWKEREYISGTFKNVSELHVPPQQKDHSWFIRYEGPGWESDKVGYRFYLDQRNAVDVFGKKTSEMVLQQVGLDGFDSYHAMQPWGMDVMKVGLALGVGSIGAMVNGKVTRVEKTDSVTCAITENGNVYSSILTRYLGWKIGPQKHDVQSRLSIHAGTRLTHESISITGDQDTLVTGIIKDKAAKIFSNTGDAQHWAYVASYGKQSLNDGDELGLAVFVLPSTMSTFSQDDLNHLIVFKPSQQKVDYFFLAAWVGEPDGIKDEAQFLAYVNKTAAELAAEVNIEVIKSQVR